MGGWRRPDYPICAIARSEEAKALGVGTGEPASRPRGPIARHRVRVFSSNYVLHGDMSRRVDEAPGGLSPEAEVYSIDETFLGPGSFGDPDLWAFVQEMRATVRRRTGIPTEQPRPGGTSRLVRFGGGWPTPASESRATAVR